MDQKNCECMADSKYDPIPKVYVVGFRVYGVDHKNVMHTVVFEEGVFVIAVDAEDVITQLKKDYVNVEFNHKNKHGMIHIVGQEVRVDTIEYCGILSGLSEKSLEALSGIASEEDDDEI